MFSIRDGFVVLDPIHRRIRHRAWAVDMSNDDKPELVYVYTEGRTQTPQSELWVSVHWDSGGLSMVRNDENLTWLDDGSRGVVVGETD